MITQTHKTNRIINPRPGNLYLGTTELNSNNLEKFSPQIKQWGKALTENADILLYGCNVAAKQIGLQFIQKLHQLTGANIAASNNKIGNRALGGDWKLEVKIGQISTPLPFTSAAMASYQGILGPTLLKDIYPGGNGSFPSNFINLNNTLYFTANDGTNGVELWGLLPATITNVTATTADSTYGIGTTINITATFSEAVTVTGTPQLQLETGTTDKFATYTSGSGGTALTFNYVVQAGDTSAELEYLSTSEAVTVRTPYSEILAAMS